MKILLYCCYRVGSKSFGDWLSTELKIPYYFEPLNVPNIDNRSDDLKLFAEFLKYKLGVSKKKFKYNYIDFITKIVPGQLDLEYKKLEKFFDKIIVLYRENTTEQAESGIWAFNKKRHHQNKNTPFFYEIDDKFLNEHEKEILETKENIDVINNELKKLKNCLHITYEEFYYSDIGIKKIEDYLGIKTKTLPNSSNKLRNGSISDVDRLKTELKIFNEELKRELKNENNDRIKIEFNRLNENVNSLKSELNNLNNRLNENINNDRFKNDLIIITDRLKNELLILSDRLKNELLIFTNNAKNY